MTGNDYEKYVRFFRRHPGWIPRIKTLNRILTMTGFLVYPSILVFLLKKKNRRIIPYILIPGAAFLLVSLFRRKWNRPRPYEREDIDTLTDREKKGESFPSRHLFSYSLIAVLLWSLCPPAGCFMLLTGIVLAWVRVILGVHYPSDVAVGMLLGILSGWLTLFLS